MSRTRGDGRADAAPRCSCAWGSGTRTTVCVSTSPLTSVVTATVVRTGTSVVIRPVAAPRPSSVTVRVASVSVTVRLRSSA